MLSLLNLWRNRKKKSERKVVPTRIYNPSISIYFGIDRNVIISPLIEDESGIHRESPNVIELHDPYATDDLATAIIRALTISKENKVDHTMPDQWYETTKNISFSTFSKRHKLVSIDHDITKAEYYINTWTRNRDGSYSIEDVSTHKRTYQGEPKEDTIADQVLEAYRLIQWNEKELEVFLRSKSKMSKEVSSNSSVTPDHPIPIRYKQTWMAIKNTTPEKVIEALKLHATVANWKTGMSALDSPDNIFITPVMDDYVILIGDSIPLEQPERLDEITSKFDEVLLFANHRTVDLYCWIKFQSGKLVRRFYSFDGLISEGELTCEEQELGFERFYKDPEECDMDDFDCYPNEEDVFNISIAWGVNPYFEGHEEECSTGYIVKAVH